MQRNTLLLLASAVLSLAGTTHGQAPAAPVPTRANVAYGEHPRQVLDFWQAAGEGQKPLLFYVHGGGWMSGDKANPNWLKQCLESGISVVSINYRLIPDANSAGLKPPVKTCLEDAARALQFVRSQAAEWQLDPQRVVGCGGSAGGFTVLWLAFHPDLADSASADPVARQSTRLLGAQAFVPQTSLDPEQIRAWIPNNDYGPHAFALPNYQAFLDQRETLRPLIEEFSPYHLATADDPSVYLFYDTAPQMGQPAKDPPHAAAWGAGLVEKLQKLGVKYEFNYPGATVPHPYIFAFIADLLKVPAK